MSEHGKEKFFYTVNYPHRWSSGPDMRTYKDGGWEQIESLEEARELAEKYSVHSWGDDRCVTTYGVAYGVDEELVAAYKMNEEFNKKN